MNSLNILYQTIVFKQSKILLLCFVLLLAFLSQYASNFRLDASSDSLVLENDTSLKYYRDVVSKYNTADFLVVTYAPLAQNGDLFSDAVLADLGKLRQSILDLGKTKSILSILDVPLTQSPPLSLAEANGAPQLLMDAKTDRALAKKELSTSQLYRDLLVSDDFTATALIISLNADSEVLALLNRRNQLRELKSSAEFNEQQRQELKQVTLDHQQKSAAFQLSQDQVIEDIRQALSVHEDKATIFLGGLPMIVTDSIDYIQTDVMVFGSIALLVVILILIIAFRQPGWVAIPLIICASASFITLCLLGLLNWPISVVSSNFLSLLLIITLSLNIHLIVRYRELSKLEPEASPHQLVRETISSKLIPCIYTAITTMVAFASLIVSGIRPVIDFGYIMCLGILVAFITTFLLFPSLTSLIRPKTAKMNRDALTKGVLTLAKNLYAKTTVTIAGFVIAAVIAIYGLANLSVENRFIDYFKSDTEIYQGMYQIDEKFGGTTPIDIILDAPDSFFTEQSTNIEGNTESTNTDTSYEDDDFADFEEDVIAQDDNADADFEDDFEDDFADEFIDTEESTSSGNLAISSYWYNQDNIQKLHNIHASLEAMPETGKVLSLSTSMSVFDNLKDAQPMDDIDLGFMYNVLSDDFKNVLFAPYMSDDANQVHISIRAFETRKGLDRNKLIADIRSMLVNEHGLADDQVNISGYLVLYNNMLNSLFSSQIMTLGTVFLVILLMFMVLFRNIKLALITLIPNVFSAAVVLGLMGIFSIPLDLMTITIAAISVGIAVDNSIHYVMRFRDEYRLTKDYPQSIETATSNIGQAMFYTTLVITAGFLIMVFSNFVPTMYFGILTAIAMVTALIANLLMLPMLLGRFKPLK